MASGSKILIFVLATVTLSSCGVIRRLLHTGHRSQSGEPPAARVSLVYDETVSSWEMDLIEKDLGILADAGLMDTSANSNLLGIPSFHNEDLRAWLQDRIHYVVGEHFSSTLIVDRSNVKYIPQVAEFADNRVLTDDGPFSMVTVMSNFGAAVYTQGKDNEKVYAMTVNGEKIVIKTPRVGIIQIGEGLFTSNKVYGSSTKNDVNTYLRLKTYFHEARHSDGNGKDTGFMHAKCPSGDFVGQYACDEVLNGSYLVGVIVLEKLRDGCNFCSSKEKSHLDITIADHHSRVLPAATMKDGRPESIP